MTRPTATLGLCLLCALVFSAFAVQSASAAEAGTTAFTCKETGPGGTFTKAHCKAADAGSGNFSHVAFKDNTPTALTISNETTGGSSEITKLQTIQSGVNVTFDSETVSGTGTLENKITAEGKHYTVFFFVLSFVAIRVTPEELKCKIKGGQITTNELIASSEGLTEGAGKKMHLKLKPATGEVIAKYELEGCTQAALNGVYEMKGSITTGEIDGATIPFSFEPMTGEKTLKVRGQASALQGSLTIKGKDIAAGDLACTPLSWTTVET